MIAAKTITSPVAPEGIVAQRDGAENFLASSMLDAIEVMYKSGFSREALYWAGERCEIAQTTIKTMLDVLDVQMQPLGRQALPVRSPEKRPRGQ